MSINFTRLAPLVAALALTACSDSTGPSGSCTDETGTVEVTVRTVGQLTFDWEPACAVALVLVEEDATDRWGIIGPEDSEGVPTSNPIEPPLTYGVVPPGATQFETPDELEAGATYELVLWRVLPAGSAAACVQRFERMCLMAVAPFTR